VRLPAALALSVGVHVGVVWLAWHQPHAAVAQAMPAPKPSPKPTRVSLYTRTAERPAVAAAHVEEPATAELAPVAPATEEAPAGPAGGDVGAASTGPEGGGPAPAAVPAFDVTALHQRLSESARRCYPAAARRFGLSGEATVAFCLDASGALTSTTLAGSSGQSLLDTAARECVIAGALPFPADAAGGCYSVPVRFSR
jgi:TonB family protein